MNIDAFPQIFGQLKAEIDSLPLTRIQRQRLEALMQASQQAHAKNIRELMAKQTSPTREQSS